MRKKNATSRRRRVRNAVRRGHLGFVGKSPSLKAIGDVGDRMVQWESRLERDAIPLIELSTAVKTIAFQAERISLGDLGHATPDFHAGEGKRNVTVIEVKPATKLADPLVSAKLEATRRVVLSRGQDYVVLTEHEIRSQPLADNVAMLSTYRRPYVDRAFLERNLGKLLPLLPISVAEARRQFDIPGTLETLLAFQMIEFDYRTRFTEHTVLHRKLDVNRFLFKPQTSRG